MGRMTVRETSHGDGDVPHRLVHHELYSSGARSIPVPCPPRLESRRSNSDWGPRLLWRVLAVRGLAMTRRLVVTMDFSMLLRHTRIHSKERIMNYLDLDYFMNHDSDPYTCMVSIGKAILSGPVVVVGVSIRKWRIPTASQKGQFHRSYALYVLLSLYCSRLPAVSVVVWGVTKGRNLKHGRRI